MKYNYLLITGSQLYKWFFFVKYRIFHKIETCSSSDHVVALSPTENGQATSLMSCFTHYNKNWELSRKDFDSFYTFVSNAIIWYQNERS